MFRSIFLLGNELLEVQDWAVDSGLTVLCVVPTKRTEKVSAHWFCSLLTEQLNSKDTVTQPVVW